LQGAKESSGISVVIDVLRCFTTETIAFQRGAEKIILVAEIEKAMDLKRKGLGTLLMGEVAGKRPEGFDYGNSPVDILDVDFEGKTIIQSTRAGTVGVVNAGNSEVIYGGSLVAASATVEAIKAHDPKLVNLIAMGLEGRVRADEDEQCALFLKNLLQGRQPDVGSLKNLILVGEEAQKYGNPLTPHWPKEDLDIALNVDSHDFAIRIQEEDGYMVSRKEIIAKR
tara:strand:- start:16 stop:690 length:675 start_codon:yes stop_codon:yes gene_type:complete